MIEGFCGGLGSGKTLRMSMRLSEYQKQGFKVLTNFDFYNQIRKINPLDLVNGLFDDMLDNAVIGLTEAYTFMDSRFSGSEASKYISYFIFQTRKRKVHILYDAQIIGSVDLRLRYITNRVYECKKILIDRNKDAEDLNNIVGFIYKVTDDNEETWIEWYDANQMMNDFKLYDTHEILIPSYIKPYTEKDLQVLVDVFNDCDDRNTFITLIRAKNPFISYDKTRSIYSLLKANRMNDVKDILNIR